ncbi:MAG: hypothetical protein ACI85V_001531 [bacterium]|jgi:hypothetical protein
MKIHALWCHPRSVSTAFERIMRERGDLDVLHEPFMYDYYLNQSAELFPDFEPEKGHPTTFAEIRKMILERSEQQPVFFKDMAYYVEDTMLKETAFIQQMTHCFLIRDPAESILSYHRRDPEFSLTEVGLEAQFTLYQSLISVGISPLIITADDLREDPQTTLARYWAFAALPYVEDAFEWDKSVPEGWNSVKDWHAKALSSGAIQKSELGRDYATELKTLGAPFVDYDRHHRPFYDALRDIANHQK